LLAEVDIALVKQVAPEAGVELKLTFAMAWDCEITSGRLGPPLVSSQAMNVQGLQQEAYILKM
jgi:hypothetical protein